MYLTAGNSLLYVSKYVEGKGYTLQSNTSCNQLWVTNYFSFKNNNIGNKHTLQGNALLFRTHYQSFAGLEISQRIKLFQG